MVMMMVRPWQHDEKKIRDTKKFVKRDVEDWKAA